MQSETKLALEKLNAWVKSSCLRSNRRIDHLIMITSISRIKCKHTAAAARGDTYTLAMQKPYLACTSAASSSRTASILAMRTPAGRPPAAAAPTAEPHRRRGGRGRRDGDLLLLASRRRDEQRGQEHRRGDGGGEELARRHVVGDTH